MHSEINVKNAYTGTIHNIGVHPNLSLGEFQALLAGSSGVVAKHQVLLAGPPYTALKRSRDLHQLAQQQDKGLFLFNKVMLSPEAPEISPIILEPKGFSADQVQSSGFMASDDQPMQQALIKLEANFAREVVAVARARVRFGKERVKTCRACLKEQCIQAEAMVAATQNLKDHCEDLRQKYRSFTAKIQELNRHQSVLDRVEDDLQQLRSVTLHKALQGPGQQTLYDCMPVEKQRKFAQKMADGQKRLKDMAAAVGSEYQDFTQQAAQLGLPVFLQENALPGERASNAENQWTEKLKILEQELAAIESIIITQEEDLVLVEASHSTILKRVKDELNPPEFEGSLSQGGLERSGTIAALEDVDKIRKQRDQTVEKMQMADERIVNVMDLFGQNKTALTVQLTHHLQQISGIQNQIKTLNGHFGTFHAAVGQVTRDLGHLTSVQHLPGAYRAFLREVVRHRAYARVFEKKVNTAVEEIAAFRQSEVALREAFLRESGTLLPKEFLDKAPALTEAPPPFAPMLPPEPASDRLPRITVENEAEIEAKLEEGDVFKGDEEEEDGERPSEGQTLIEIEEGFGNNEEQVADLKHQCDQLNYENLALKTRIEALERQLKRKSTKNKEARPELEGETGAPDPGPPNQESHSKVSAQESIEGNSKSFHSVEEETTKSFHSVDKSVGLMDENLQQKEQEYEDNNLLRRGMKRIHNLCLSLTSEEIKEEAPSSPPILRYESSHLEVGVEEVVSKVYEAVSQFKERINVLQIELHKRGLMIDNLNQEIEAVRDGKDMVEKIAFRNFDIGNIALFMPALYNGPEDRRYIAFNIGCPYRFLSEHSVDIFKQKNNGDYPDFILGRIVMIEKFEAQVESNAFDLKPGTVHYILTVETLDNAT